MELVHDFTVPVPADRAFALLTDVQRIAPCLPGAAVTSVDGDSFEGGMKIKLGPISMTFRGDGELVEQDAAAGRAVIAARGRDAKGNGGAEATVTATLSEHDGTTDVHVVTDLNVTGKAAQFGGGVMKDVSNRMLAQFASNLARLIEAEGDAPSDDPSGQTDTPATTAAASPSTARGATSPGPRTTPQPTFTPDDGGLDALSLLTGSAGLGGIVKPVGIGLTGLVIGYLYGKNRVLERMVRRGH